MPDYQAGGLVKRAEEVKMKVFVPVFLVFAALVARAEDVDGGFSPPAAAAPTEAPKKMATVPCVADGKTPCDTTHSAAVISLPERKLSPEETKTWQAFLEARKSGALDPERNAKLDAIAQAIQTESDAEKAGMLFSEMGSLLQMKSDVAGLRQDVHTLRSEYRPFRMGLNVPVGPAGGLQVAVDWQPPRLTDRLHLLFGLGGGLGFFPMLPSNTRSRAIWMATASLNYLLGPGKLFAGLLGTGDSNFFDSSQPFMGRNWIGFGPMAGYRWGFKENLSLDLALNLAYGKLAWQNETAWQPGLNMAIMWQLGGLEKKKTSNTEIQK